jgi:hypothetical protein
MDLLMTDKRIDSWVRFYRNGEMVIGCVQYVEKKPIGCQNDQLCTDMGKVDAGSVLEMRR